MIAENGCFGNRENEGNVINNGEMENEKNICYCRIQQGNIYAECDNMKNWVNVMEKEK